ncbi:histidine phosphatase family protein [Segatella hominis]|uniref:histidine phosphatase family protein n=1 Tax=Segatella hominis TaxID=2518605 RepID=UPI0021C8404C|nr:histidine phosphatase family protein [Segatella hominis]
MKNLRIKTLALVLATFGLGVNAQTTFEEISADLNKAGGVYLAYPKVEAKQTPAPKGYKPFYVSHYGRHGSRYLLGDGDYQWIIQLMTKADAVNGLTPLGKDVLQRLQLVWKETAGHGGDLTPLGVRQHQGIAERMSKNFPEVFRGKRQISARSTVVYRCAMSMVAFGDRLKGLNPQLDINYEMSEKYMSYLNYHTDRSNAFTHGEKGPWVEEYRKFEAAQVKPDRLVNSLFSNADFIRCEVNPANLMWGLYWIAVDMQDIETPLSFYDIFTAQEMFDLWQCVNYRFYICNANPLASKGLVMANAKTLVENIIESADSAMKNRSIAATLRFGHDGNVIPLLALLQIENFDVAVAGPAEVYKHWCDFKATPMASNVQLVFFENKSRDVLVKFLHNEKEVHIPVKTDIWPYYHWNEVKEYYQKRLSALP